LEWTRTGKIPTWLYGALVLTRAGFWYRHAHRLILETDARICAGNTGLVGVHHRKGSSEARARRLRQIDDRYEVLVNDDRYLILRIR
jgi:hypothetical protein